MTTVKVKGKAMAEPDSYEKFTLFHNTSPGHEKQYTLWIEATESGADTYNVCYEFGPIGEWLQSGVKTFKATLKEAERIFTEIAEEKLTKGYVAMTTRPPSLNRVAVRAKFAGGKAEADAPEQDKGKKAKSKDHKPMLLTAADEDALESYIKSDEWGAQEKVNGKRAMFDFVSPEEMALVNRRGVGRTVPASMVKTFKDHTVHVFLDGELVGDVYHVFDMLEEGDADLTALPYSERFSRLKKAALPWGKSLKLVELETKPDEKRELVKSLRKGRKEGVVFKKLSAPYKAGKTDSLAKSNAVKIKFWNEGEFVVMSWNGDKASVKIGAYGFHKDLAAVGNVTVPDKYADKIKGGEVIRVRYLYATDGDVLYQPTLAPDENGEVVRDDKRATDCTVDQLRYEGKDTKDKDDEEDYDG